ncbi:MAG: hypothetical protein LBM65_03520 [Oscillospiraceae bacterium]|jgi:hypothetical protein|nr:hypothetical protein [Oscillospiraceae bacterium]
MAFAIISAIVCLACGLLLFTAFYSKVKLLTPVAVYLVFRGVWGLIEYILLQLYPGNEAVLTVDYIATIIIIGYYAFLLWRTKAGQKQGYKKSSRRAKSGSGRKSAAGSRRERAPEKGLQDEFVLGEELRQEPKEPDDEFNKRQISYWKEF